MTPLWHRSGAGGVSRRLQHRRVSGGALRAALRWPPGWAGRPVRAHALL